MGDDSNWIAVAEESRIPLDSGLCVIVQETPVALFRWNGEVYAIDDRCPHMGSSLAAGAMTNGVVECPRHGWRFRITDGAWVSCPANRNPAFPARVEGGVVYLKMPGPQPAEDGSP
jgi:nitrite reductase/ring-hydroxylating ferredoxin subunit